MLANDMKKYSTQLLFILKKTQGRKLIVSAVKFDALDHLHVSYTFAALQVIWDSFLN